MTVGSTINRDKPCERNMDSDTYDLVRVPNRACKGYIGFNVAWSQKIGAQ